MYKIILVEDEPAAAENINDIIRLYCPQFEIAAAGDNGKAGLELARQYNPDLLLTDISMPVMNGLDLIVQLHEELPHIKTMILSGYQDFEYARTALRHGAVDYLLKPISPQALQSALERIIPAINDTIAQQRLSLIRRMLNGEKPDPGLLKKQFAAPAYVLGISRKNGLPSRFYRTLFTYSHGTADGETLDVYGRDDMESLRLSPDPAVFSPRALEGINRLHWETPGYTTTVVWNKPFPIEDLPEILKTLYNNLDSRLTIGKDQVISVGEGNRKYAVKYTNVDFETKQLLDHYVKENKTEQIRCLLLGQLKKWEAEGRTQLYVEESVRSFFEQTHRLRLDGGRTSGDEGLEFMIDDAFFYAASYDELRESLLFILEKVLPNPQNPINKVDTPEFFELIREYINAHVTETVTLQSLCRHFGISQTYMSRLFRKYTNQSFINYLTSLRIEKAKGYLANKDTLIKDAAAMAGFNDQFYFSRVFRSVTGQSPSDYIRINTAL
ncbi:MAG: response regulator [Spirochaetaceae bacterium]|jgi:two-component system response regulator YesN|nr:response regulator [Spirochaetaceae bacterium]